MANEHTQRWKATEQSETYRIVQHAGWSKEGCQNRNIRLVGKFVFKEVGIESKESKIQYSVHLFDVNIPQKVFEVCIYEVY